MKINLLIHETLKAVTLSIFLLKNILLLKGMGLPFDYAQDVKPENHVDGFATTVVEDLKRKAQTNAGLYSIVHCPNYSPSTTLSPFFHCLGCVPSIFTILGVNFPNTSTNEV